MKFYSECEECLVSGSRRTVALAAPDPVVQAQLNRKIEPEVRSYIKKNAHLGVPTRIQDIIKGVTGVVDPFASYKKQYNAKALVLYPTLEKRIKDSPDPLLAAIRVAIAGNIIDFVASASFDLNSVIEKSLHESFGRSDTPLFLKNIETAKVVFYIGDNAGEIVFDKLVIHQLVQMGKKVTLAVRGGPVLNDATLEDAQLAGLDEVAEIITTGLAYPGVDLRQASPQFIDKFKSADLIISKGQGNFESLGDVVAPIFFLLKAKCQPIATELGVQMGDLVFKAGLGLAPSQTNDINEVSS